MKAIRNLSFLVLATTVFVTSPQVVNADGMNGFCSAYGCSTCDEQFDGEGNLVQADVWCDDPCGSSFCPDWYAVCGDICGEVEDDSCSEIGCSAVCDCLIVT